MGIDLVMSVPADKIILNSFKKITPQMRSNLARTELPTGHIQFPISQGTPLTDGEIKRIRQCHHNEFKSVKKEPLLHTLQHVVTANTTKLNDT